MASIITATKGSAITSGITYLIRRYCIAWQQNQTLFPYNKINEQHCQLTAGLYPYEIYISPLNPTQLYICSAYNEIFLLILHYLHCSLNFKVSSLNLGGKLVNGNWTGILALIERNEIDFIPHIFSMVNHRTQLLYHQTLLPVNDLVVILSCPFHVKNQSLLNTFAMFSTIIWTLLWCSLALFTLVYGANVWHHLHRHKSLPITTTTTTTTWSQECCPILAFRTLFETFGLMLGEGTIPLMIQPKNILRNPLILWIMGAYIFRQLFSNYITAQLVSFDEYRFEQFDQLYHRPDTRIYAIEYAPTTELFAAKHPNLYARTQVLPYLHMNSPDVIRNITTHQAVLILARDMAENFMRFYSIFGLHVSDEGFAPYCGYYAIRNNLPLPVKKRLALFFKQIYQFGLSEKIDQTLEIINFQSSIKQFTNDNNYHHHFQQKHHQQQKKVAPKTTAEKSTPTTTSASWQNIRDKWFHDQSIGGILTSINNNNNGGTHHHHHHAQGDGVKNIEEYYNQLQLPHITPVLLGIYMPSVMICLLGFICELIYWFVNFRFAHP